MWNSPAAPVIPRPGEALALWGRRPRSSHATPSRAGLSGRTHRSSGRAINHGACGTYMAHIWHMTISKLAAPPGKGPLTCSFPRADDGIRTRDPHLGKVIRLPGHKSITRILPAISCRLLPPRATGCHAVVPTKSPRWYVCGMKRRMLGTVERLPSKRYRACYKHEGRAVYARRTFATRLVRWDGYSDALSF